MPRLLPDMPLCLSFLTCLWLSSSLFPIRDDSWCVFLPRNSQVRKTTRNQECLTWKLLSMPPSAKAMLKSSSLQLKKARGGWGGEGWMIDFCQTSHSRVRWRQCRRPNSPSKMSRVQSENIWFEFRRLKRSWLGFPCLRFLHPSCYRKQFAIHLRILYICPEVYVAFNWKTTK